MIQSLTVFGGEIFFIHIFQILIIETQLLLQLRPDFRRRNRIILLPVFAVLCLLLQGYNLRLQLESPLLQILIFLTKRFNGQVQSFIGIPFLGKIHL